MRKLRYLGYCLSAVLLVGGITACSEEEEEENVSFTILVQDLQRNSATVVVTPPTSESGATYNDGGVYWSETNPDPTDADQRAFAERDADGNFRISLTGLKGATTYYVKGYVRDYSNTLESSVVSFTTPGGNPQFRIRIASLTDECYVTIDDLGGNEIREIGFCGVLMSDVSSDFMPNIDNSIRKPMNPFWYGDEKTLCSMSVPFSSQSPNSYSNDWYYVRVYIITENGIGYSNRISFRSSVR